MREPDVPANLEGTMNGEYHERADLRYKKLNTIIAAVGAFGVIVSILFGFSQLRSQSEAQTQAIRDQWGRKFYDEKIDLYTRATEVAARIAALRRSQSDEKTFEDALVEFRSLYWGPMCITEGEDVESAMVKFHEGVTADLPASALEQLALFLAHVCKNEAHALYLDKDKPTEEPPSRYGNNRQILERMDKIMKEGVESKKKSDI